MYYFLADECMQHYASICETRQNLFMPFAKEKNRREVRIITITAFSSNKVCGKRLEPLRSISHQMLRKNNVTVDAFFINVSLDPHEEFSSMRCSSYLPSQCVICLIYHVAPTFRPTHYAFAPTKHEE